MITLHQTDSRRKITTANGELRYVTAESPDVVINPNYIVAMVDHSSFTTISMVNGNTFSVKESVQKIQDMIAPPIINFDFSHNE